VILQKITNDRFDADNLSDQPAGHGRLLPDAVNSRNRPVSARRQRQLWSD
jgi:hypothetical protein